jgi:hypothetical protein
MSAPKTDIAAYTAAVAKKKVTMELDEPTTESTSRVDNDSGLAMAGLGICPSPVLQKDRRHPLLTRPCEDHTYKVLHTIVNVVLRHQPHKD